MSAIGVLAAAGFRSRRRVGVVTTFVVLVLAGTAIASGLVVSRQGARLLDDVAADAAVAHLVLSGDPDAIRTVAEERDVTAWSGPFPALADVELLGTGEPVPMMLVGLDAPDVEVGRPTHRSGRWARAAREIVLDHSVAEDLGLDAGDVVRLRHGVTDARFRVVGTAVNLTDCFYPQCDPGRAWVTDAGLARLGATDDRFAQGWLRFRDPAEADPFVQRLAAAGVDGIGGTESWLDTREDFLTLDRVFGSFVAAFGIFVLAVAAVIIAGSTAVRIVTQRRTIGLYAAIGSTPRQITLALLTENLALGGVAATVGWFLAGFLSPSLQLGIGRTLGAPGPTWTGVGLVVTVATVALLMLAATVVPAVSAARRPVTDVLRDAPRGRVSWLNRRMRALPRRLELLGAQEAASQPVRGGLAALAIVVAVVGTIVSIGFVGGIDAVAADPARQGDPWDVAVVPGEASAGTVEQVLDRTAGVARWFGELERRSTFRDGAFLSVAISGDPAAADYRISDGRAMTRPGEAIAGYGFLERFGVDVGDRITVRAGTTPLRLRVVGEYRETEDSGEVLRYRIESLTATEPDAAPDVYRAVTDDADTDAVVAALTRRLGPGARLEVVDTGTDDLAPFFTVLRLIAVVLLVMAGINLLTTLLTAGREASGRLGVELAMGFTPGELRVHGAVAGAVLGAIAAVVGVVGGLVVFRVLADTVSRGLGVGAGWMPSPAPLTLAALAASAVVVAGVLGALATDRVVRRPATELLRAE